MATPLKPMPPSSDAELTGNVLFYVKPEPLSREMHGKMGLKRVDRPFGFAANSHIVPVTVTEFPLAGLTYPVIFAGDRHQPIAVMGVSANSNLFVTPDGSFALGAYIPAYIRRYPFVLANDTAREQLVVCIDRSAIMLGEDYDLAFFDDKGEPTDYTKGCIQFCNDFEAEGRRTESFVNLMKELDLFETKTATYTPVNPDGTPGTTQTIAEYFAISEAKLKALPSQKLLELVANGAVCQIYAHLMSLAGWERIIALALAAQAEASAQPAASVN